MTVVPITSPDLDAAEVSWFSALCSDDYQFLGVPDGGLRSSWSHCSEIVKEAEAQGCEAAEGEDRLLRPWRRDQCEEPPHRGVEFRGR